ILEALRARRFDVLDRERAVAHRVVTADREECIGAALRATRTIRFRDEQRIIDAYELADELAEVREVHVGCQKIERRSTRFPDIEQMRKRSAARIPAGQLARSVERCIDEHR